MRELLPCPFCGGDEKSFDERRTGKPMLEQMAPDRYGRDLGWRVICYTCRVKTWDNAVFMTPDAAISAWNKRPTTSPAQRGEGE